MLSSHLCILLLLLVDTLEGELIVLGANLIPARDRIRREDFTEKQTCEAQHCAATII